MPLPQGALDPRLSPDGKQVAFVSGGELHVLDIATGKARALTTGATEWKTHGLAEFVAQEEMDRREGYWWSPDSRSLAFEEADDTEVEKLSIQDPARPERRAGPVRLPAGRQAEHPGAPGRRRRGRAGPRPGSTGTGSATPTWPRCAGRRAAPLLLVVQNRAQTEEAVLRADPASGKTAVLLVEKDAAWLNLNDAALRWMPDGSGFLWFTERSGGAELELRSPDGAARLGRRAPGVRVRGPGRRVGRRRGLVPRHPGRPDPRPALPGPARRRARRGGPGRARCPPASRPRSPTAEGPAGLLLPPGRGFPACRSSGPTARSGSGSRRWPSSRPSGPGRSSGRSASGGCGPRWSVRATSGPGVKYPVIVQVYGGPTRFSPLGLRSESPRAQWTADQGFLVVKVVNRGETARLGRDFERAVKGDLAGPALEDQVEALDGAGARSSRRSTSPGSASRAGRSAATWRRWRRCGARTSSRPRWPARRWSTGATTTPTTPSATWACPRRRRRPTTGARSRGSRARTTRRSCSSTARPTTTSTCSTRSSWPTPSSGPARPATFVPLANVTHLAADPATAERLAEMEIRFFRENLGAPRP